MTVIRTVSMRGDTGGAVEVDTSIPTSPIQREGIYEKSEGEQAGIMSGEVKVAVVTGGGTGIGRLSALALWREGFSVVVCGRRLERLEAVVEESEASLSKALAVQADVGNPDDVEALFNQVVEKFGRVDLLFNNAGMGGAPLSLEELSFEQWKQVVDVNLNGAFLCTRSAMRIMKDQKPMGGRIINNGSISAQTPRPNSAPYTATKHAMTGLTKSTSLDGRKYNIACGQIDIGNADTRMVTRMQEGIEQADGSVRVEPVMDTEHVAEAVVHMANLPLDANVLFMTIMATKMPYTGRG